MPLQLASPLQQLLPVPHQPIPLQPKFLSIVPCLRQLGLLAIRPDPQLQNSLMRLLQFSHQTRMLGLGLAGLHLQLPGPLCRVLEPALLVVVGQPQLVDDDLFLAGQALQAGDPGLHVLHLHL